MKIDFLDEIVPTPEFIKQKRCSCPSHLTIIWLIAAGPG